MHLNFHISTQGESKKPKKSEREKEKEEKTLQTVACEGPCGSSGKEEASTARNPLTPKILSPNPFPYHALHTEVHAIGLDFTTAPLDDWHAALTEAAKGGDEMEVRDPGVKLVGYLGRMYGGKEGGPRRSQGHWSWDMVKGRDAGRPRRAQGERL